MKIGDLLLKILFFILQISLRISFAFSQYTSLHLKGRLSGFALYSAILLSTENPFLAYPVQSLFDKDLIGQKSLAPSPK